MKTAQLSKTWILLAAALPAMAQQSFDFKTLDKLAANAKESTNITLEGDALKLATGFLGQGADSLKGLTGVYVRSYEYEQPGQYKEEDLAPLRAYIKSLNWAKIVDVKEPKESTEIYLHPLPDSKLGGLAIVSAEAKEITVVLISGVMNAADLGKLGGNFGVPSSVLNYGGKDSGSKKNPDDQKKD